MVMDFRIIVEEHREDMIEKLTKEKIIKREILKEARTFLRKPNILAILGVRRCGKSVFSWQIFENEKFGYINFADERLEGLSSKELNDVLVAFYSLYGKDLECIILDEIQNVHGWERFASRLRNTKKVIITGSNSTLLSGELSTFLTGRHLEFELFPFSFRETLKYMDIEYGEAPTSRKKSELISVLEDFLEYGGFPERFYFGKRIVKQIFNDIVIKDVVVRAGLKKKESIVKLARYLVSNSSSNFTYRSLKGVAGTNRSATVSEWVSLLEEAYLIFRIDRFSPKLKEQFLSPKKVYSVDNGLINAVGFRLSENTGRLMENLAAVELMRRRSYFSPGAEIFYFRDSQGHEVDFVIKEGHVVKELIQVTYANSFDEIEHREIRGLLNESPGAAEVQKPEGYNLGLRGRTRDKVVRSLWSDRIRSSLEVAAGNSIKIYAVSEKNL